MVVVLPRSSVTAQTSSPCCLELMEGNLGRKPQLWWRLYCCTGGSCSRQAEAKHNCGSVCVVVLCEEEPEAGVLGRTWESRQHCRRKQRGVHGAGYTPLCFTALSLRLLQVNSMETCLERQVRQ